MRCLSLPMKLVLVSVFAGTLAASPALADQPSRGGGGGGGYQKPHGTSERYEGKGNRERGNSNDRRDLDDGGRPHFNEQQRISIQEYFADQHRRGRCPPGLAKKDNGCTPPGHAKRWMIGQPLPRDVIFHDLPPAVLTQLGSPPQQHRYVRVAQDILLIATENGMVADALDNLIWEFGR